MRKPWLLLSIVLIVGNPASADTRHVVTQETQTDCGPAALATLLRFYLDVPTTEAEVSRLSKYDPGTGTSLLGLEEAAVAKGCTADSFRMTWENLREQVNTFATPLIVRTLNPEPHFTVFLGTDTDYIYLADPAIGNIILRKGIFLKRWLIPGEHEGYVFLAEGPIQQVNTARRTKTLQRLRDSIHRLRDARPPISTFAR